MSPVRVGESPEALGASIAAAACEAGALVLCTDFDGTLAPLVAHPAQARALAPALASLRWLGRPGAAGDSPSVRAAVVTSRSCDDLLERIDGDAGAETVVVGCAGLEVHRRGATTIDPEAVPWLSALAAAAEELGRALGGGRVPGAWIERKGCGVVVHTRGVHRAGAFDEARQLAVEVGELTGLRVVAGKHAVELRPPVDRDKATGALGVAAAAPEGAVLCVAGDDLPDLAMLRVAATRPGGIAVAVADDETPEAVVDAATERVDGPRGWAAVLSATVRALESRRG